MHKQLIFVSTGHRFQANDIQFTWTSTGIYLQQYQKRFFVKAIDPSILTKRSVQVGDELKSCDGRSPVDILNNDILPYESVSAHESASYRFTPEIFYRWDQKPKSHIDCEFVHNGSVYNAKLYWKEVSDHYLDDIFQRRSKIIYEIEKTPYGHWVKLKSLAGYEAPIVAQLKTFVSDAAKLRKDHGT